MAGITLPGTTGEAGEAKFLGVAINFAAGVVGASQAIRALSACIKDPNTQVYLTDARVPDLERKKSGLCELVAVTNGAVKCFQVKTDGNFQNINKGREIPFDKLSDTSKDAYSIALEDHNPTPAP